MKTDGNDGIEAGMKNLTTSENTVTMENDINNGRDIYDEVDSLFFEDVAEYTKDPMKLITKLNDKYKDEFKSWKSLHADHVNQGDLVRMRGMILNGVQVELSLGAVVTIDNDGSKRTVCGILRNSLDCSNIKEVLRITRRNAYIFVPERGTTNWYLKTITGENCQPSTDVLLKDEKSRILAKFYGDESEEFGPNLVFDLYGIIDLIKETIDDDIGGTDTEESGIISLHVIHYEPVEHHDVVASTYPEVMEHKITHGIDTFLGVFEQLFGNRITAELLACQLIISRNSLPRTSVGCIFPSRIKNVRDSKPIIEMIKLFVPKVHVIEMTTGIMEKSWASFNRPESGFEQGLLQVSNNTLVIIDETKLSEKLECTEDGDENLKFVNDFISTQRIRFVYPYQTVEIDSDISLLILSNKICFFDVECAVVAPKSIQKNVDFVQQYAANHENELILSRHALLSCRKNLCDVDIDKHVEETAVESFLGMQQINRDAEKSSTRLHRQLMISKMLAALKDKKVADKECWTRAVELENEVRISDE